MSANWSTPEPVDQDDGPSRYAAAARPRDREVHLDVVGQVDERH
jgi:hypothetical protein